MNKMEVKTYLKEIRIKATEFQKTYLEQLAPLDAIMEHREKMEEISEEHGIELDIDWEQVEANAIRTLLEEWDSYTDVINEMDDLESELEEWSSEASESRAEKISEMYQEPLTDLKDMWIIDNCTSNDEVDEMVLQFIDCIDSFFDR